MQSLRDKNILLGITGGIAAYKSLSLVRLLRLQGAQVQVVLTKSAQSFVTPLTVQTLSGHPVRTQLLDPQEEHGMDHIALARWADAVLIAPASAHCIAKLAQGFADDLLSTLCLATTAPIAVAPAMNQAMWSNPITQRNVQQLQAHPRVYIWGPDSGAQACGETGPGRMQDLETVLCALATLLSPKTLTGKRVLVSAGPTQESIDPVRYVTNHSSGKMGYAVAQAAYYRGAQVTLISGPTALPPPHGVRYHAVTTAQEMHDAVMQQVAQYDIFVSAAAVMDRRPASCAAQKLKKPHLPATLAWAENPDILASVAQAADALFTVGFAAETEQLKTHARKKLQDKQIDVIAVNAVDGANMGFRADDNALWVLWSGGEVHLPMQPKTALADALWECLLPHLGVNSEANVSPHNAPALAD